MHTYRFLPGITKDTPTAGVDYETYWGDDLSVSEMSYWHYSRAVAKEAYLVGIVTNDGFRWVGHPKDAPWDRIRNHVWVSHNRAFDQSIHEALQEINVVPSWTPSYWGDSMNLCAWLRVPRSLAMAVQTLYGQKLDKTIRDVETKNKRWSDFSDDLKRRVTDYGLVDTEWCLRVWLDYLHEWPDHERRVADLITNRGLRGIFVNKEKMEAEMDLMKRIIFAAEQKIPWRGLSDSKGKPYATLSAPACNEECRKIGIPPPPSLSMADEGLQAWEDQYGEQYPFVGAMRDYRRINGMLKKYQVIWARIKADGRFEYPISYLGTFTGRTSGTDLAEVRKQSANMLNMPRLPYFVKSNLTVVYRKDEIKSIVADKKKLKHWPNSVAHTIDLRSCFIAPPGKKFVICDKAQIEARITNWFARDKKTLAVIKSGASPYEAHAITFMNYTPKPGVSMKNDNSLLYNLAKARELALGYQAGHVKFLVMAPMYVDEEEFDAIFDKPVSSSETNAYLEYLERTSQTDRLKEYQNGDDRLKRLRVNSWIQVEDFRAKKPGLTALWRKLHEELKRSASTGGMHEVTLPSGRVLRYLHCRMRGNEMVAKTERGPKAADRYVYGGKILANAVSGTARDVFVDDCLRLDDQGIPIVLDVYDEVVCEVDQSVSCKFVQDIMSTPPSWATTLPVAAEAEESYYYKK